MKQSLENTAIEPPLGHTREELRTTQEGTLMDRTSQGTDLGMSDSFGILGASHTCYLCQLTHFLDDLQ